MSDIHLEVIIDRLITKYGREGFELLKTAEFTREQLLSPALDPDRYAYLMATRGKEVEKILNAQAEIENISVNVTQQEVKAIYKKAKELGKIYANTMNAWFATFTGDLEHFKQMYPQAAATENIFASMPHGNAQTIYREIWKREVAPTYDNLVIAYGDAMIPKNGTPKLQILCPDGVVRTGKPLQDAIRQWSIELLEPQGNKPTAEQTQSADDFLADHPELRDTRQSPLLQQRFMNNWFAFLKSPIGRAYSKINAPEMTALVRSYLNERGLAGTPETFAEAAKWVANRISVTLFADDAGLARSSSTVFSVGGGDNESKLPLGQSGMAGQRVASPYNPDKKWSPAEARRELRRLTADELKERMADAAFVAALDEM